MNFFLFFLLTIIFFAIARGGFQKLESFDGIGKSFGQFYFPKKCCKSRDCYPGMYAGPEFISRK
tara:strand:+ start:402 stop:593 length:192 start_codon:yes stop_codon:yes gene_type:complete